MTPGAARNLKAGDTVWMLNDVGGGYLLNVGTVRSNDGCVVVFWEGADRGVGVFPYDAWQTARLNLDVVVEAAEPSHEPDTLPPRPAEGGETPEHRCACESGWLKADQEVARLREVLEIVRELIQRVEAAAPRQDDKEAK